MGVSLKALAWVVRLKLLQECLCRCQRLGLPGEGTPTEQGYRERGVGKLDGCFRVAKLQPLLHFPISHLKKNYHNQLEHTPYNMSVGSCNQGYQNLLTSRK